MSVRKYHLHDGRSGAALAVRVTPRASRNSIKKILPDGTIAISLIAPPVEGKANDCLVKFLAEILDVPPSKMEIISGEKGRNKLVIVLDIDSEEVQKRLSEYMADKG